MTADFVRHLVESATPWDGDAAVRDLFAKAEPATDAACATMPRNDYGNGQRLAKRFGRYLRHVADIGWYFFDGQRWSAKLGADRAYECAHRTSLAIGDEARALQEAGPLDGESEKDFGDRVDAHRKWATASGNRSRIDGMLLAASPYLSLLPEQLDVDPWALNVANGTLNLRPSAGDIDLRPQRHTDYISRLAPVAYDPEATCPTWRSFLDRVLPSKESQVFLQRWTGYSLTGDASEQRIVVLYGAGANGKSTFVDTLHHVVGDYGIGLPIASLMADDRRRGDAPTPDLARLPGARWVRSSEPKVGFRLDEAMVKAMTSGEPMTVRHLNKGFFEFSPIFKLTLSTNHKPVIRGTDTGIWRRLVLVPFDVEIPEAERDRGLAAKLKAEAPGILAWALDGYRLWAESGLSVPASVELATADYRAESDPIGDFIALAVMTSPGSQVTARDLYEAYKRWCAANAIDPPISSNLMGRLLKVRGFKKHDGHVMSYRDIRLVENQATMFNDTEGAAH